MRLAVATLIVASAVAARPAAASAGQVNTCSGIVLFADQFEHPDGINYRAGPGVSYPVVGRTRTQQFYDTALAVQASRNGWFEVQVIGELGYRTGRMTRASGFSGRGWISASQLFVRYPEGQYFDLHRKPASRERRRIRVELETSGPQQLLGCKGSWVQISHSEILEEADNPKDEKSETYIGWIPGTCRPHGPCPFRPSWGKGAEMGDWPYAQ